MLLIFKPSVYGLAVKIDKIQITSNKNKILIGEFILEF